MCGILGIYRLDGRPFEGKDTLKRMGDIMAHRGPDGEGFYAEGPVGLGHRRLSILDLSVAGAQPMATPEGRYVVTFNGEVYNYVELREELRALGHAFHTGTDTEVILHAFAQWGEGCVRHFNGMFAFAIYDTQTRRLFCARDRFGVKPFYYANTGDTLVFASEIKAILAAPGVKAEANPQALYDFLQLGATDHREDTCFKGILHLQPGHHMTVDGKRVEVKRWWTLAPGDRPADPPGEFRRLFLDAVRLRLRSDVPVGTSLSGGLDSTAVVSAMREISPEGDLHAFSAVFPGSRIDESEYVEIVSKEKRLTLHKTQPRIDTLQADLERLVYHQDEPFGSTSNKAQWEVMKLAHGAGLKVLLDGQGADEELAGYHYFFANYFTELIRRFRWIRAVKEAYHYRRHHKSLYAFKVGLYYAAPRWMQVRFSRRLKLLDAEFERKHARDDPYVALTRDAHTLNAALAAHMNNRLQHLLRYEDRNSMAFSIETRLPFLDYRLAQTLFALPGDWKIRDGTTKYVMREGLKGLLPEAIRTRQGKIGFETDEARWFRDPAVVAWVRGLFTSERFRSRGIANEAALLGLLDAHVRGEADWSRTLWRFLNVEIWFRVFIDKERPAA